MPLRKVAEAADESWRGGMVVTLGDRLELLDADHDIWSVPVHRLL
ncbi:MAG: hypothetical protein ABFS86_16665 [Planctomycetota bacterium]